jgi:hypothetical protein
VGVVEILTPTTIRTTEVEELKCANLGAIFPPFCWTWENLPKASPSSASTTTVDITRATVGGFQEVGRIEIVETT